MTREEILRSSDSEIIDEINKFHYMFSMDTVIRHNLDRKESFQTQSVSEHIFNMITLMQYFLPLEDVYGEMDYQKITQMILWHDIGEIETGDYVTHEKTEDIEQAEIKAHRTAILKCPNILQSLIQQRLKEYENCESRESKFVNALDKLEGTLNPMTDSGHIRMSDHMKLTKEQVDFYTKKQTDATQEFSCIYRFTEVGMTHIKSRLFS